MWVNASEIGKPLWPRGTVETRPLNQEGPDSR